MLDIRIIREQPELIQKIAIQKGIDISINHLLKLDIDRRKILHELEQLRQQRNTNSQMISKIAKTAEQDKVNEIKQVVRKINESIHHLDSQLRIVDQEYQELMNMVPNIVSADTPIGESDEDNVEIRQVGDIPNFNFSLRDHVQLGEMHELFDIPRGVKVAGTRNYFLKGIGVHLHRAVQQLAIDLLTERDYIPMDVPLMVREEMLVNTGFFPLGREQTYEIAKDQKWLVGTSEVSLVSYFTGEEVDVNHPIRLFGISNCFRREAGSAGRDVHGLYRVHQFSKVEQVVICKNDLDLSEQLLQEITKNAEDLLQMLELPYRVVSVCTGDIGQGVYKKYDIETWMPSRENFGETQSASILLDFQSRRSNIRYRENGQLKFCHTLNNTAVATPRILIPLLENHQRDDGSIYIPKALRKYMYGLEEIK